MSGYLVGYLFNLDDEVTLRIERIHNIILTALILILIVLIDRIPSIDLWFTGTSSIRLIGTIEYDRDKNLGKTEIASRTNAYVYKGRILHKSFAGSTIVDREAVAVKKISCGNENNFHIHLKEVSVMLKCDEHPNIVQYYCRETDNDFHILIAMELCLGTVQDLMDSKIAEIGPGDISDVKLLHQIAKGVEYLHGREPEAIIHRDLKPTNILLKIFAKEVCVKLCDFGISRVLPSKKTSVTLETNSGSVGWSSPDVLRAQPRTTSANDVGRPRLSRATDIFSLGLVYYYKLSKGHHPFDGNGGNRRPDLRDFNIRNNCRHIDIQHFDPRTRGYVDLLEEMIEIDPGKRPSIKYILSHPLFWEPQKELNFFIELSNVLNDIKRNPLVDKCKIDIKKNYNSNFNMYRKRCEPNNSILPSNQKMNWIKETCNELQSYISRSNHRNYNCHSILDLIRLIRNLSNHFNTLPKPLKKTLGQPPYAFMSYWITTFPVLLPSVWEACRKLAKQQRFSNLQQFY